MTLLAIDAASSGVTAAVLTADGSVLTRGHRTFPEYADQDHVEHAPEEIWRATLAATREVLEAIDPAGLQGLTLTTRPGALLVWDRDTLGAPLRAIGWHDRRSADICSRLRSEGHEPRVTELTGLPLDPRGAGPRLAWLAEHEPRVWALVEEGSYAVGSVESYLVTRMTRGTYHLVDAAQAAPTLLLDVARDDWSAELCALFGVPVDALPELVHGGSEVASADPRLLLGLELPITLARDPLAPADSQGS